jgi:hypothetical protein
LLKNVVTNYKAFKEIGGLLHFYVGGKYMRVSGIDKAFGATFVDVEGLKFVDSLAYRKGGSLYVYLKGEASSAEEEVQKEIDEVFKEILGIGSGDVELKERRARDYRFNVLNEKNVKNAFAKLSRKFKSETE